VGVTGLRAAVVVPRRIPDPREEVGVAGRAMPEAPPRSVPLGRAWVAVRGAVTAPLRMIFGVVAGADRMVAPERIETPEEDLAAAAVRAAW
jgi:sec-independent protein translocase protein tatB-like protein